MKLHKWSDIKSKKHEGPRPKRHRMCDCGRTTEILRCEEHDAYFCPACHLWLEDRCSDPRCLFCKRRPDRPCAHEPETPVEDAYGEIVYWTCWCGQKHAPSEKLRTRPAEGGK